MPARRLDVRAVLFAVVVFEEPHREVVLPEGRPAAGFEEVVIDASAGHRPDGGREFTGMGDADPRVEHDRGRLHEIELVPRACPRDHRRFSEPFVDHLERRGAELAEGREFVGIEDAEALREHTVPEVQLRPHGEIVPVVGVVEGAPERRLAEMVEQDVFAALCDPIPQFPQVDRGGETAHPGEKRAILHFERGHADPSPAFTMSRFGAASANSRTARARPAGPSTW